MARLKNAPVEYVLGVLRFPVIADVSAFAGQLQAVLRDEYPLSNAITMPHHHFHIEEDGMKMTKEDVRLWQFSSMDRKWAVIVAAGLVGLHTVDYHDHEDFIERFLRLVRFASNLDSMGIRFVESIAVRYLDLIVPREGESVDQYVQTSVLPMGIAGVDGLETLEGVYVGHYKTGLGNLRFQVLRNPPSVFPPELISPMTQANNWGSHRPQRDFVVMDTDHGMTFDPPIAVADAPLRNNMMGLRGPISEIFRATTTGHAQSVWNGEA